MIEADWFTLYLTMNSGKQHMFEVTNIEIDHLLDKMFNRTVGNFADLGWGKIVNITEIEFMRYEELEK